MLHVRGPDINESPSSILNRVHNYLYNKYKNIAEQGNRFGTGSTADAALLQEFLQAWKLYKSSRGVNNSNIFTDEFLSLIEQNMPSGLRGAFAFKQSGGTKFEKQLSQFIYGLLQTNSNLNMDSGSFVDAINTGSVRTTRYGVDAGAVDQMATDMLTTLSKGVEDRLRPMYERAQADLAKIAHSGVIADVQIKTDIAVKNVNMTISVIPQLASNPYFFKVLDLLSRSNITAKNYDEHGYGAHMRQLRGMIEDALHLGDTNTYRAIFSVLGTLGWSSDMINSVYYATYSSGDSEALSHFAHIRFIYELTGSGQMINNVISDITDADFLIWNDYNSNRITVRSTADLVRQMMDDIFNSDLTSGVHIRFVNLK